MAAKVLLFFDIRKKKCTFRWEKCILYWFMSIECGRPVAGNSRWTKY